MATATTQKTNLRHLLEEQARDLYNAETKYSEFITRMKLSSDDKDLAEKFSHIRDGTTKNIAKLKEIHALTHPAERPRVRGYESDGAAQEALLDSLAADSDA